jgi:hypothetical protein
VSRSKPQSESQNALLGDLESIRTLLEDDEARDAAAPTTDEELSADRVAGKAANDPTDSDEPQVPVLDDVVDTNTDPVTNLPTKSIPADGPGPAIETPLDDDLFRVLLSDEWRESASEILNKARAAIDEHRAHWSPEETDSLNDALKVRIDATIQGWMRGMVVTRMAELHELLARAMSDELKVTIEKIIDKREAPDGQ